MGRRGAKGIHRTSILHPINHNENNNSEKHNVEIYSRSIYEEMGNNWLSNKKKIFIINLCMSSECVLSRAFNENMFMRRRIYYWNICWCHNSCSWWAGVGEEDDGIKGQPLNYHPATHQLSCGNLQASFGCHNKSSRHPLELTVDSKANPAS